MLDIYYKYKLNVIFKGRQRVENREKWDALGGQTLSHSKSLDT